MRDVAHERWRLSLAEALREIKPAWHGVKLDQPDWSSFSHSVVIGGELKSERILAHIISQCVLGTSRLRTSGVA